MRRSAITNRLRKKAFAALSMGLAMAAWFVPGGAVAAEAATPKAYMFGVFPYLPPREIDKVFAPMAVEFSKALGREVRFTSSSTYEIFAKNIEQELFDIAFVQPFDYVDAADRHGYLPLASRAEKLKAVIVTVQGSDIKNAQDLRGKRISLPPEDAAVSHLTRAYLRKNGLVPVKDVTLNYFRSHMSCLQQVLIDATVACGTAAPALRYFKSRMNIEMRVIAETDAIPHSLFIVHPRVPPLDQDKIRNRILSWSKTPEGKEILERGKLSEFIPITDDAYDVVRNFPRD